MFRPKKCPQTYPPWCLIRTAAEILKHRGRNVWGHLNRAFSSEIYANGTKMNNILPWFEKTGHE